MPDATPAATTGTPAAPPPGPGGATPAAPAGQAATPVSAPPSADQSLLSTPPTTTDGKSTPDAAASKTQDATQAQAEVELKFPEGFKADEGLVTGFKAVAKELGLKSESAQKLADIYVKAQQAQVQAQADAQKTQASKWAETTKADPEYGGAKFDESLQLARKAVAKFGTPALTQALNESGMGNHPELVRLMARVGLAMSEDSVAGAQGATTSTDPSEALHRAMYPSTFQK